MATGYPVSGDTPPTVTPRHVAATPPAEPRPVKKTAEQVNAVILESLRELVRLADAAGQRDAPHVMKAREALALVEPKPEPKPVYSGSGQTGIVREHAVPPRDEVPVSQRLKP